jgi:acetyl-CoA carboxylase alpha subunit
MWSLVQMAKTIQARRWHAAAGLAHVAVLGSPTTGGVYASFVSLADVIFAEPEARIGFAGPRVVEELTGETPPPDVHTAGFAYAHGLIDAIVARSDQPAAIGRALRALTPKRDRVDALDAARTPSGPGPAVGAPAWERLRAVRDLAWPAATDILDALIADAIDVRGDRTGFVDDHVVVRIGGVRGTARNVVAIGQQTRDDGRIRPEGFRTAVRAIELAGRLGLPVLTIIDTRGADPLPDSEGRGIAAAIARTFEAMLGCPTPTLAVLTGEGGSGGALAMAVADRIVAFESAVFSVIAPEGAATILYRDPGRGPELADALRITVGDLVELGLVDTVVAEPEAGVRADRRGAMQLLAETVAVEVSRLATMRPRRRGVYRRRRWRSIATAGSGGAAPPVR